MRTNDIVGLMIWRLSLGINSIDMAYTLSYCFSFLFTKALNQIQTFQNDSPFQIQTENVCFERMCE